MEVVLVRRWRVSDRHHLFGSNNSPQLLQSGVVTTQSSRKMPSKFCFMTEYITVGEHVNVIVHNAHGNSSFYPCFLYVQTITKYAELGCWVSRAYNNRYMGKGM